MAQKTRTELKAYFETGDKPTEAEFIDLIDSIQNIKDDGILIGGQDNITAHAGGGQANAYQLTKKNNRIGTCATTHDSVKLPVGIAGMDIYIWNDVAAVYVDIFPATGGEISNQGVNASRNIFEADFLYLHCYAANKWLGSAGNEA